MKIEDLTLEKFAETASLMKQLHLPWIVVDMAKELGVKRTELMKFINEHPKNINTKYYGNRGHAKDILYVVGIYHDACDNPLTEEYAASRRREHWINLRRILYEGWVRGFEPLKSNSWENQDEDMEKYHTLPGVGQNRFAIGYAQGSHYSDWHSLSVKPCDFNKMVEEGHKMGLRFKVEDGMEVNTLDDLPDGHFRS